jgi:hypothetical protein
MCTFRLGIGGSPNASVRENPFGEGFATEHRIVLSVPGRFPAELPETVPEFDLLSNDGQYQMLVKCEDISGNPTLTSYPINFEVMQTPDTLEPILTNFRPISGSYVLSGATSQAISFRLNEPAECKWDSVDTNFLSMANSFYCDTSPSNIGFLQGYHCSGTLTNITSILNQESAYYIRCKDQPWLEWNEDEIYSRNENRESKVYVLKPSAPLIVSNVLPNGSIVSGSNIPNITLSASTSNGAEFGKASCRWRYTLRGVTTSYYPFTITNSSSHSVLLNSGLVNGSYLFQVMCQDVAGNIGYGNSTIELRVDRSAPIITRVFNDKGNLKIGTSEPSVCKYMFGGASISCLFSLNSPNLTAMYGTSSTEHTTPWRKGSTYLLKCQDLFGNENTNCGMVVNAY